MVAPTQRNLALCAVEYLQGLEIVEIFIRVYVNRQIELIFLL